MREKKGDEPSRESAFTAQLAARARTLGFKVYSINQTRRKPRERIDPGVADIFMAGHGVNLWVETKVDRNRQSVPQVEFEEAVKKNGGLYWLCRTMEEFMLSGSGMGWWRA